VLGHSVIVELVCCHLALVPSRLPNRMWGDSFARKNHSNILYFLMKSVSCHILEKKTSCIGACRLWASVLHSQLHAIPANSSHWIPEITIVQCF
jgi:hypothetical protein